MCLPIRKQNLVIFCSYRSPQMATRKYRISEFNTGIPPADQALDILCEDKSGTYVPPFACHWVDGAWLGPSNIRIAATVLGWRERRG